MITSLRLHNFRRHVDTEVRFDDAAQIILIDGSNGVGKTTLLEAIVFAFYGESRHGARQLDRLVRRGAELEGMEVECTFTADGTEYRVIRRRDNRVASAVLFGNDQPLTEGTAAVTDEIGRIFGMDSAGFRLAVVAQQKQLDGLASLRPGERAATLAKLLRLDVIGQARDRARSIYRVEREVLRTLGDPDDFASLERALIDARETEAATRALLAEVNQQADALSQDLLGLSDVAAAWTTVTLALSRAEGREVAAEEEVTRLRAVLSDIVIPNPVTPPDQSSASVRARQSVVASEIARADAAAKLTAQRRMLEREAETLNRQIASLESIKEFVPDPTIATELADCEGRRENLLIRRETATADLAVARSSEALASTALATAESLGAVCDHCGQTISDDTRLQHHREAQCALDAAAARVESAQAELVTIATASSALGEEIAGLLSRATAEATAREADTRRRDELVSTRRRLDLTLAQIDRLGPVTEIDVEALHRERADLAVLLGQVLGAEEHAASRALAVERQQRATQALRDAEERHTRAADEVTAARPSTDLVAAHDRLRTIETTIAATRERAAAVRTQAAVAAERLESARQQLDQAAARREERRRRETAAVIATNTADVLDTLSDTLTTRIRPVLEGAVSEVLALLSDGRFSAVQIDQDYAIKVFDDGRFQPLGDFSGGEIDLIALAMRLALASVVADRQGHGPGFLILDEVFGSQDGPRRSAITNALRNLRHVYGQVFLISHVGGLEDEADVVVHLDRVTDDETLPSVTASVS